MTSRQVVYKTIEFDKPPRVPQNLWPLPWAGNNYPKELERINKDFPTDITFVYGFYKQQPKTVGERFEIGEYIDEWGCKFTNIQRGIVGEIKDAIVDEDDLDWTDTSHVHFPKELLTLDVDMINRQCRESELFTIAEALPRPFEQLQFIRKTEQLYMDLADPTEGFLKFVAKMHEFYCELCEVWAKTDVDALQIMDDWGSQNTLLINPKTWVEIFKPMYKDYCDIARRRFFYINIALRYIFHKFIAHFTLRMKPIKFPKTVGRRFIAVFDVDRDKSNGIGCQIILGVLNL